MQVIFVSSTVSDGNMSLKWGGESEVRSNRERFVAKLDLKFEDFVVASLVHGTDIAQVSSTDKGSMVEVDGLVTCEKNVGLWMVTGDCLPVVFYDKKKEVLGMAHLGWRGVDKKLAEKMIEKFRELGCNLGDVQIWIGPSVRKESYCKEGDAIINFKNAVDLDQWKSFLEERSDGKLVLDLVGLVIHQLVTKGALKKNIIVSPIDTVCDLNYFSQYRSYSTHEAEGRFATVAMIKS